MRHYLIGLAAAAAVAVVSAPAMAGCGGCGPAVSYSSCNPCGGGYAGGWGGYNYSGGWGYATLPQPAQYYAVQPQYYYVNQGPTYTGPGAFAPVASYQQRAVSGFSGYGVGYYGYGGGPYANPTSHMYYGAPAVSTPTVYSYRRAYRPYYRPAVRYGYGHRVYAPRHSYRYGYRHHVAPRYSVAPHQYGPRPRVLRRYY
jgi:hypothetical protein